MLTSTTCKLNGQPIICSQNVTQTVSLPTVMELFNINANIRIEFERYVVLCTIITAIISNVIIL